MTATDTTGRGGTVAAALAREVRAEVSTNDADRVAYARDLWPKHLVDLREGRAAGTRPHAIVWPTDTEQVATIVRWCAREGVPIVPFGAGSGVCGGVLPDERTIVLDLKRMKRWRSLDEHASTLDVEAGAMGITLEEDLQRRGFTIGHFPSSILCSTVGGWIAARGAGQCSGKYGKIEDMVVDLEVVDGRGEIARLRRRLEGPDLVPIMIGSEGTLGVITSATMRLHPAPKTRGFASFGFASTERGWEAMRVMFQRGLRPAVARLYDPFDAAIAKMGAVKRGGAKKGVRDVGAAGKLLRGVLQTPKLLNSLVESLERFVPGDAFGAMSIFVFEGDDEETTRGVEEARAIALELGGTDLGEGPAHRWLEHRYAVSYRQPPMVRAGAFLDTMEVAAPWSKLGALYRDVRHALGRHVFVMAHLSHAYPDGCSIYFTFAGSAGSPDDAHAKYDRAWRDALDAAIAAGGTLSHHHGVGRSKAPRLGAELGVGIDVVRALMRAFDPKGILNPGNLVPNPSPRMEGASESSLPTAVQLDEQSLLACAPASATLQEVERVANARGMTLGLSKLAGTVSEFVETGCPGAVDPLVDPVDHAVAGLSARLPDGRILTVRDAPRRAVGPDLVPLVVGARRRFATPLAASLRLHLDTAKRPTTTPVNVERNPKVSSEEEKLFSAIEVEMKSKS